MVDDVQDAEIKIPTDNSPEFQQQNYDGMLANHFAGFAMQALIASNWEPTRMLSKEAIAQEAFEYSIAMLEERKKYS